MGQNVEDRIAVMEQQIKDNQAQNLAWVSNMAAHLVKMDGRMERLEEMFLSTQRDIREMLLEMRAERHNGAH